MKKIILNIVASMMLLMNSCNNMEDYFLNPDKSVETKIEYLWTQGLVNSNFRLNANVAYTINYERIAYWTDLSCFDVSVPALMDLSKPGGNVSTSNDIGYWNRYYKSIMPSYIEAERIYKEELSGAERVDYDVYMNIIKICKALETSIATDLFGDMPYSEAFTARSDDQIIFPKFDTQQSIYYAILADLKTAVNGLADIVLNQSEAQKALPTQDLIYNGDISRWRKFANSLRLRLAIRISDIDATKAKEVINDLAAQELIESNFDNTIFAAEGPDGLNGIGEAYGLSNRTHYDFRQYRDTYAPALFVDEMSRTNDPRLSITYSYANSAEAYVGFSNDPRQVPSNLNTNSISILDTLTFEENIAFPGIAMTASEVHFLKAEAIKLGFMRGDAEDEYKKGVRSSVEFYFWLRNLNTNAQVATPYPADIDAFIIRTGYTDAKALESIWMQKRIHLGISMPFESWSEFRRTDFPKLSRYVQGGTYYRRPVRFLYSTDESVQNSENFESYRNTTQNDRVWWDVVNPQEIN
ncbi:MAG: SusD/RagB family nutrient-binding outer membrane lipoprotein [Bacteroidales bacterium]